MALSLSTKAEGGNLGLFSHPAFSSPPFPAIDGKLVIDTEDPVDPNEELVSSTTDSCPDPPLTPATSPPPDSVPAKPESEDTPLRIKFTPLRASQNHESDFGSSNPDPRDSGLEGKRNNRMRGAAAGCSSIMLRRSSSVATETRLSRSSPGS